MEIGFWVGSSDVIELGAERIIKEAWEVGATRLSIFVVSNGKVYFKANEKLYKDFKPIKGTDKDILAESLKYAREYGLKITATIVCVVDPEHAKLFPNECLIDFNGKRHEYGICPNSEKLRDYLSTVAYDIASNYEVDEVELDYIRYKRSRDETLLPIHLFVGRYCYCDRCLKLAKEFGIDVDELNETLEWFRKYSKPTKENIEYFKLFISVGDIARLYSMNPILAQWLNFRYSSVAKLVGYIKDRIKETGVKLSADLFYPTLSWQVGQNYKLLGKYLDAVKPMIYTARMGAWETRYLKRLMNVVGKAYEQTLLEYISILLGIEKPKSIDEFELKGAPSYLAYRETMKVKDLLPSGVKVYTGLYSIYRPGEIENPPSKLEEAINYALKANPNGLYFFSFRHTPKENREVIKKIAKT